MQKKPKLKAGQESRFVPHMLASAACGIVLTGAFLAAFAKVLCQVEVPVHLVQPFAITAVCLAVLLTSLLFSYLERQMGVVNGLGVAGVAAFVVLSASLVQEGAHFSMDAAWKVVALLASGAVGGYCGMLLREKRRKIG